MILFFSIVPLSLYVTIEFGRIGQSNFISWDHQMYHPETNSFCKVKTSSLNEELGLIEHIFSDKTGTLTENQMTFRFCSVAGAQYGGDVYDSLHNRNSERQSLSVHFNDAEFKQVLEDPGHPHFSFLRHFLFILATCQTIVPKTREDGRIEYMASSPDELALVEFARHMGVALLERVNNRITLDVFGERQDFEILNTNAFSSTRRRMSVILRNTNGEIKIFMKGADSVMSERMAPNQPFWDLTLKHLDMYSVEGLRTLVFAEATLDPEVYQEWDQRYRDAASAVEDREEALEAVAEDIEKQMNIIGATAVEDRLQDGVPDTIQAIRAAGIRFWMLTGDRQETAINIGHSANIVGASKVITLNSTSMKDACTKIRQTAADITSEKHPAGYVLVMNGVTLIFALHESILDSFIELASLCSSVIICRATPLQKCLCVKSIKERLHVVTLAIGDGANDVSMIQAANVGIGIRGKEGVQAALSSDYAISQFRFLHRLLFVHGHWCFHRMSEAVLYILSKHFNSAWIQVFCAFVTGFSTQTAYDATLMVGFTLFFSFSPALLYAMTDKDVPEQLLLKDPQLYRETQAKLNFRPKYWMGWILYSVCMSAIEFYVPVMALKVSVYHNAQDTGLWLQNLFVMTCLVFVVNIQIAMIQREWTYLNYRAFGLTFFLWLLFNFGINFAKFSPDLFGVFAQMLRTPIFYLVLLLVIVIAILPLLLYKYIQRTYYPRRSDILLEQSKYLHEYSPIEDS
eukprot:TRINITY_DN1324_c0_g1_i1.p1 TRINITY_DN1324_c0_g1~~TRINITY_DN1324_c0_g1_i1.p1  ORF type:complete len:744 (+),score=130.19 TRINITY_DN1324_c0_g1_i1:1153-3384(+)